MLICKIHSNSNKCSLKQTSAKYSREFLIDNIFMCGERVFQQTVDIHMGTDAPLVA